MARQLMNTTLFLTTFFYLVIISSSLKPASSHRRLRKRGIKDGDYMVSHWGIWGPWSSCSRSCGGGVAEQTRHCLRRRMGTMVLTGANQCVGLYKQYKLCNTKPCSEESTDFRTEQCEKYNHEPFMGNMYQWETFIKASAPCELNCRAKGHRFYVKLAEKVVDGTTCGIVSDRAICVDGMCKVSLFFSINFVGKN
ncbi:thrombospondin type-1 domain-containing protein 4-like [Lytechinus variegatus]|uniref:thrombospondin type-1 domain-containing protein 4-like n=1 Tax=Lytechinus variegatus TaxID=7654 RepID=UPI001BB24477|nr:thrombospondin type-1 domain-containing protein 4-like [Lytechinus variegatus]